MTGVDIPDKYTAILNASRPWVEVFDVLNQVSIIDPVTFQSDGLRKPTGTGPFMFVEYAQGDHLRLIKNPNYWRSGLPYFDEVLVSIYRDAQAAVVALDAGALDVVGAGMPVIDLIRLQGNPAYQVLINEKSGTSWDAYLNCTLAPTDNKLVRQALSYAMDRQRMADTVWHGLQKPLVLPWSSASPAYEANKNAMYAFDLSRARSLLARASTTNLKLDISWAAGTPEYATIAQVYQSDLLQLGLEVTLTPMEAAAARQATNNLDYPGVQLGSYTLGNLNPASSALGLAYGPQINFSGFRDDAYTQLVNQVVTETEPSKQKQLYAQLNDYYLDQAWVLHIVQNPEHAVATASLHGLRYDDGRPALVLAEAWLASS
jgi:peptide/nickel transport system substrate-binding protein